jgi:hypothetical protein
LVFIAGIHVPDRGFVQRAALNALRGRQGGHDGMIHVVYSVLAVAANWEERRKAIEIAPEFSSCP